ncbi:MAG: TonB-dependent receptor [Hyphomonadaceae bacterium]|nr:TonB-dependent receptor [Hyphomonadaceae bacterium]
MGKPGVRSFTKAALKATAIGATSLALQATGANAETSFETLSGVTIEAPVEDLESPKYTAPLLDTPQTITIVPAEVIQQQNLLNLRDVLSTLPGITFGAGEGGGGYGDSINIRGYAASNDITVDGVRDSAQYSRTDPFNLEQIELSNGANSVYAGAGSVGGSINLVSKRPHGTDRTAITIGAGTDAYGRITADIDRAIDEGTAFRLNVMMHQNDVPGREVEEYQRFGIAPSITFGRNTDTQLTLSYLHQQDDNTPQYGVPYALNIANNGVLPGVNTEDYFGLRNLDRQETQVDQFTALVEHEFNENLSLRNLTRYQLVTQDAVTSAVQGSFCTSAGVNPYLSSTGTVQPCTVAPGTYLPSGPRGNVRNTENTLYYNQTDLTAEFSTGGIQHTLVAGLALTREEYDLVNGSLLRNADGSVIVEPAMSLSDPSGVWAGSTNFIQGGGTVSSSLAPSGHNDGERENIALYVFDAVELSPNWEVNGGVRVERNEGSNTIDYFTPNGYLPSGDSNILGAPMAGAQGGVYNGSATFENDDTLVSYRLGLIYKPAENASFYVAYGNSQTPSQATVNGACSIATCNVDPEEAVNYEAGVKWDGMGGLLQLTAAVFRNERTNYRVASNDPSQPDQALDGESRVDGIALGAAGLITDNWSIFANYTFLDSEVIQGVSDFCLANPGASGCTLGGNNAIAGDPLPVTPEHSASLWSTYDFGNGIMVGYGLTYQGEYTFARPTVDAPQLYTDDYLIHRAMVAYELNEHAVLQLNANNLTDEEYFTRIRNNATSGWATPGEARSFVLSLNLRY